MLHPLIERIQKLFQAPQPTRETVSPNWEQAGEQAAKAFRGKRHDKTTVEKAFQKAFHQLHQTHLEMCRQAKVRPDDQYSALQRFKTGWMKNLE